MWLLRDAVHAWHHNVNEYFYHTDSKHNSYKTSVHIYFFVNETHLEPLYCLQMKDSPRAYTHDDIDCIRSEWAEFVGKHVHCA